MATRKATSASKSTAPSTEAPRGYTVLARRYRSTSFDEIVGQEAIARTLKNSIERGRTAHAYLFCGTRGVGKTSMARIFAKALNVTNELTEKDAIAAAILRGDDIDVIEIDGASNRGVDNARELIANAGLAPTRCPYKIYIIDEVHMLTREAFNALLKTMEEPPAHVKFILCTTEPQKVPATIQSRCQRFDFRAIPASRIADHLKDVLAREKISAEDEAVAAVARLANGSMRDALSLLDRLLAGESSGLTVALLEELLGLPDQTLVASLVEAIVGGDAKSALEKAGELVNKGLSVEQAIESIIDQLRALLFECVGAGQSELLELSTDARRAARALAPEVDAAGVVHMIAVCEAAARSARVSSTARTLLDAVVVRLCMTEHLASIPALLSGQLNGHAAESGSKKKVAGGEPIVEPRLPRPEPPVRPVEVAVAPTARPVTPSVPREVPGAIETTPRQRIDDDSKVWPAVVQLAGRSKHDSTLVELLELKSMSQGRLALSVVTEDPGLADFAAASTTRVSDLVREAAGRTIEVQISVPERRSQPRSGANASRLEEARRMPLVQQAMNIFGASVVDVQDAPSVPAMEQEDHV